MFRGAGVGEHLIDFPGLQGHFVALVVHHYGEGGSLGSSIAAYRSFQLTQQRAKELRDRLQDDGHW